MLSDWHGARVLAQLLWGLSYQRYPNTLIVLDNLDPNPFDAAPFDPGGSCRKPADAVVGEGRPAAEETASIAAPSRRDSQAQTPGLTKAIEEFRQRRANPHAKRHTDYDYALRSRQKVSNIGGLIVLAGGTLTLRDWAVSMAELGTHAHNGMDYTYLAGRDGEVQIFRQYRREVSIAKQARRDVLANPRPGHDHCCLNIRIWRRVEKIRLRSLKPLPVKQDAPPARLRNGTVPTLSRDGKAGRQTEAENRLPQVRLRQRPRLDKMRVLYSRRRIEGCRHHMPILASILDSGKAGPTVL